MVEKKNISILVRPRRNRKSEAMRSLLRETRLHPHDLVLPLFVIDGKDKREPIASMPGCFRLSIDQLVKESQEAYKLGVQAIALFPNIKVNLKDAKASESKNPHGLLPQAVKALKKTNPKLLVITDVAMDPYSSDGHDGYVKGGKIQNDTTLPILADMALTQARAGADIVAPSDMMDGRVGYIRKALDKAGFEDVGIISYAAKYCSSFYGPFRDALDSTPKAGDKKTYQMDPANIKEALREVKLDIKEGADIVMVKPALLYLDVIKAVRQVSTVPVAAYHVSGEYAMVKAAAKAGWLDESSAMMEALISIKRAGASVIFTYFAKDAAKLLKG